MHGISLLDEEKIKDIKLQPANDLLRGKTTCSGINNEYRASHILSMFCHAYHPENSFVAVPPDLFRELAEKAGSSYLVELLDMRGIDAQSLRGSAIKKIKEKIQETREKKNQS